MKKAKLGFSEAWLGFYRLFWSKLDELKAQLSQISS